MNEDNMSLPSYWDLADEIKAFKIENNILKDKIKASKRLIKILFQRHDKFAWKENANIIKPLWWISFNTNTITTGAVE